MQYIGSSSGQWYCKIQHKHIMLLREYIILGWYKLQAFDILYFIWREKFKNNNLQVYTFLLCLHTWIKVKFIIMQVPK